MTLNKKERQAVLALKRDWFNQLDRIYKTCEKAAHGFGKTEIPLSYLKECIDITKKGFIKGQGKV